MNCEEEEENNNRVCNNPWKIQLHITYFFALVALFIAIFFFFATLNEQNYCFHASSFLLLLIRTSDQPQQLKRALITAMCIRHEQWAYVISKKNRSSSSSRIVGWGQWESFLIRLSPPYFFLERENNVNFPLTNMNLVKELRHIFPDRISLASPF